MKKNVFFSFAVLFSLVLFGTCKVGLGGSVDVSDPKLEIKYPASGSVIRGTFTLYGSCSDDKGLNRVEVSVLNGELSATEREKEENFLIKKEFANVSGEEWTLSLNQEVEDTDNETDSAHSYNGWQFADGKIIVRAVAYDDEGHNSGTYEISYDIDNTAPVLIASAPGVVYDSSSGSQKYSEYGTSFSIKGEMSEDHSASINVAVFNETDDISTATPLLNKTFEYVKISDTSPYEIARSVTGSSSSSDTKRQNYIDIYVGAGASEIPDAVDGSDGTKKFKTAITLTDSAKSYVNPKEITDSDNNKNETTGNSTTWLFLYSDVYSTYQDPESEYAYTVDDFKNMVNETKFSEGGFSDLADFRSKRNTILDNHRKSDETPLAFSLNPYATPTYSISGFALGEDGSVSGDTVNGDLFSGKAAVDSTIVVVANKATGSTRKLEPATFKLWAYPLGSLEESVEKATIKECIALLKEADIQGEATETVDDIVVKKTEPKLTTQDENGNSVETELTDAQKAVWTKLVLLGENSSTTKTEQDSDNFEVKISDDVLKIEANNYYLLVATGADVSGDQFAQNSYYGFIGVDNFQPASISETQIGSTEVYKTAGGQLKLAGVISKGSVDIATVYIEDSLTGHQYILDEDQIVQSSANASNYNWNYTFIADSSKTLTEGEDWQNYVGAGEHTFTIRVVDAQANKSEVVRVVSIDMTPPDISSFTVTPVTEITEASESEEEVTTEYVNGKITVRGTATDANAFKAFDLAITDSDGKTVDLTDSDGNSKNIITSETKDLTQSYMSWSYVIDTTKLDDEKTYTLTVSATDGVGNTAVKKQEINIKQSSDTPVVSLSNAESYDSFDQINDGSTNIFGTVSNNKIMATVSDDDGISLITVAFVKEGENENAVEPLTYSPLGKTTYNLNCTIPSTLGEGGYTVTITVKDTLGETSCSTLTKQFCIALSSSAPTIKISQTNEYSYYKNSLSLTGTVSGQSVKVLATYPENVAGSYSTQSQVSGTTFTDSADISGLADNKTTGYSVTYTATDRWGQTAGAVATFYKDTVAPVFDADNFKLDSVKTLATVNNSWFSSYNPSLSIKYAEAVSSKDKDLILYIWVDPSNAEDSSVVKGNIEKYSSKLENKAGTDGTVSFSTVITIDSSSENATHTVYVQAQDLAGNLSGVQEFNVQIDLTAPTVNSKYFRHANSSVYEVSGGEVLTNKQNDIYFYGNVYDSLSGVAKIDGLAISSTKIEDWSILYSANEIDDSYTTDNFSEFVNGAGFAEYDSFEDKTAIKSWQIIIPSEKLSSGELKAVAYDNAGLQTNLSIAKLTVDISAPVVNYGSVKDADADRSGTYVNKKIQLTGTTTDTRISEVKGVQYRIYDSVDSSTSGEWTDLVTGDSGHVYKIDSDGSFTSEKADSLWADDSTAFSWKTNAIDTQGLFADSKTKAVKVDFRIIALDTAGNDSVHSYKQGSDGSITATKIDGNVKQIFVDQSTDRPKITITNLELLDDVYLLNQGTSAKITGQITDDDRDDSGIQVKKLIISDIPFTGGDVTVTTGSSSTSYTVTNGGTTTLSNSGTFTFEPAEPEENGSKQLYIYVEDNQGGVFYTTATDDNYLVNPKLTINATALSDKDTAKVFEYTFDSESPKVASAKGILYSDAGTTPAKDSDGNDFSFDNANSDIGPSFKAGGKERRYIKFKFEATDANGIAGMTFSPATDCITSSFKAFKTTTISSDDYTQNGTFTTDSTDSTKGIWQTDVIDLSEVPTGSVSVVLTVFDKSNRSTTQTLTFSVDNDGPVINVTNPSKSGAEVTGSVTISGTLSDKGDAGVQDVYWLVPETDQTALSDEALAALTWNGGSDSFASDLTISSSSWGFLFDGKYDTATSDPTNNIYKAGNPKLEVYDSKTYATTIEDGPVYTFPVYFKIVDKFGNYTIKKDFTVKHNPDGDKPKVKFTYPTTSDYEGSNDYVVLGGTIRTTGTAEIPSGTSTVNSVYYQLGFADAESTDSTSTTYTFQDDAKTKCKSYGYTVVNAYDVINEVLGKTLDSTSTITDEQVKEFGFETKEKLDAWWGIKAGGTASWNVSLNSKGELNPSGSETTTNFVMRACGVNADGKFGNWTTGDDMIGIHIDNTAPVISAVVNQYPGALEKGKLTADPATSASQNYDAGMYLKGSWYLVVDVLDETEVKTYTVSENGSSSSTYSYLKGISTGTSGQSDYKTGYRIYIPINKDNDSVTYTITATDVNHNVSSSFEFNIDNKAPEFNSITGNGTALTSDAKIADSNYRFTLSDTTSDTGSGLSRVAFYFVRKNSENESKYTKEVVLDPMITTGTDDSKISLSDLTALTITQDSTDYTLYAQKQTGIATLDTFTLQSTSSHIRAGGLIYIDGVYRLITKIEGKTVSFEPSLAKANDSIDAYFPIAQIVDNTSTEKITSYADNPFNITAGDDGDGMPETFSKSGSNVTWDASIHTTNIPDGPVTLVVLAFDKAGNVSGKSFELTVANNAPRLAKLWLGTDLNGDGKYSSTSTLTEFVEYDIIGAEGAEQSAYELDFEATKTDGTLKYKAGKFTVKNGLAVVSEFTGGNGEIGMVLNTSATSATATTGTVQAADANDIGTTSATKTLSGTSVSSTFTAYSKSNGVYAYVITKDTLGDDSTKKAMSFTFWDSTEETTQGSTSQNAVLYIPDFVIAQTDNTAPLVRINPFYWNSSSDNSLYGNSLDNGHIELEDDWKDADGYDSTAESGVYDGDPKVSGKVVFTGTAYDNSRIASIKATYGSLSATVSYDSSTGKWSSAGSLTSDGYEFKVYDADLAPANFTTDTAYFDQNGHKVYWTLTVDTEKVIKDIAAADQSLKVIATDSSSNETSTTAATTEDSDAAYNKPTYQTDVVPYITSLGTSLTSIEKRNPSVYGRSALGRYPVYYYSKDKNGSTDAESITFNGFNLSGGTVTFESSTTTTGVTGTLSNNAVTLPSGAKSGKVSVTVNSITTLNNVNNNDAIGSYSGTVADNEYAYAYNRQPNGQNNNILTDDVEIAVWELKSKVAIPSESSADAVIMHVNPSNGLLGFAFTHGADLVSYPNGTTNSYENWAKDWTSISQNSLDFVYDANGNMFGTHSGTDTASTYYKASRYRICSSVWGVTSDWKTTADYNTAYGRYNALRLEYMGYYNNSTNTLIPEKIKGSRLATTTSGNATNLYLLYYDTSLDMLKFKAGGTVPTSFNNTSYSTSPYTASLTSFGDFADDAYLNAGRTSETGYFDKKTGAYSPKYSNISVLTKTTASRYFAISAVPASVSGKGYDVALALWYDPNTNNLLYSYLENPLGSAGKRDASGNVDSAWSEPIAILDGDSDGNCAIEVDSEGHVHIAARTLDEGGSLCYVYLDNYKAEDYKTDNVVMVDGYDSTGTYLTLDIAKNAEGGRTIPYIGYMTSRGYVKYAYLVDTKTASSDSTYVPKSGSDSENLVTGAWETILVPKKNQIVSSDNSKISIGVFRDMSTDVIKAIPASIAGITESAGTEKGYALGNGTKNAILGYGITIGGKGYAETAQLK